MKKIMGAAMLVGAAMAGTAGVANAEGSFSGSVTMSTDYVFRGISQSDGDAAVSGSLDYTDGIFYAGVWASSLGNSAASAEYDAYVGLTPTTGPVAWDLALIGYFYPGAGDDPAELDYYELKIAPSIALTEALSVGAAVFYSPDNYGETDTGVYLEVNASYALSDALSVSAAYGNQTIDDIYGPADGSTAVEADYDTWSIGAGYSYAGFDFGLVYTDTNIDDSDPIAQAQSGYAAGSNYDSAFVFSIGKSL